MELTKFSKEAWKGKIEKELRGKKTLEDLKYQIGTELQVDSLFQEEDRVFNDSLYSFPDQMSFGIKINNGVDNSQLLSCLNNGGSCFYIPDNSRVNWNKVFENVDLKLIDIFVFDPDSVIASLNISELSKDSLRQNFHTGSANTTVNINHSMLHGTLIKDLTTALSFATKSNVHLELSDSYLLNIGILRALRILIQQIDEPTKILTSSSKGENSNEYDLIRFTTHVQTALAGGSNYHFYPCESETPLHFISKMMHVSNVINLESTIEKVVDPWRGSYTIEHITKTILKAIEKRWSRR